MRIRPVRADDHFCFAFAKSGEYGYYCKIHPRMTGKVVVK
jgi:plastocyanin